MERVVHLTGLFLLQFFVLFPVAAAESGFAVASAHPLATDAGIEILHKGGNAFDAAIAVSATLAVVEPYSSGLGGGGFWLLHEAESQRDIMIDGRERAPLAASRDMYLDAGGKVIANASVDGPRAAGIPGVPAALEHLSANYGRLPFSVTLESAIQHARQGFVVEEHYRRMAKFRLEAIRASKDAASIFLKANEVPEAGEIIRQIDLASTLERIAKQGAKGFYRGELAEKMVASVRRHGGLWDVKDLADYQIIERQPTVVEYKGMKLVTVAAPSSGGIALAQMLNMLSHFNLETKQQAERIHLLAEVMRRAYRDRAEYLGDPDFVDIPTGLLTSSSYNKKLAESINENVATPSAKLKAVSGSTGQGRDTTHFSIMDKQGNRVSATLSINYPFGSGFVAEGTGVLLNDEMDDFSARPGVPNVYGLVGGQANAIEPGKRMLSSMSPGFLETEDRIAVLGTPGGSRIITMVLLATLDFHNGGSADHMVKLGRFHHQYLPDRIYHEPGVLNDDVVLQLMELGHDVEQLDAEYGNMHVIISDEKHNRLEAASDPRGLGKAVVIQ